MQIKNIAGPLVVKVSFSIINFFLPSIIDKIDFCSFDRFRLKLNEKFRKIGITIHTYFSYTWTKIDNFSYRYYR